MTILQPQSTDTLNSPDHALSHRVFANDGSAPVESVVVSSTGNVGVGNTNPTAFLHLAAPTTSYASLRLTASAAVDVSAPNSGDMWWNGTNLYFYNGATNKDLLAGGGAVTSVSNTDGFLTSSPTTGSVIVNADNKIKFNFALSMSNFCNAL